MLFTALIIVLATIITIIIFYDRNVLTFRFYMSRNILLAKIVSPLDYVQGYMSFLNSGMFNYFSLLEEEYCPWTLPNDEHYCELLDRSVSLAMKRDSGILCLAFNFDDPIDRRRCNDLEIITNEIQLGSFRPLSKWEILYSLCEIVYYSYRLKFLRECISLNCKNFNHWSPGTESRINRAVRCNLKKDITEGNELIKALASHRCQIIRTLCHPENVWVN